MIKKAIYYIALFTVIVLAGCTDKYDVIIARGILHDGNGGAPYQADIAIKNGEIVKIGELSFHAKTVIDAKGLWVTPGFIDVHTHCDGQLTNPEMSSAKNYLTQGVTTVVTGNCGSGTFNVENYFGILDSIGIGPNVVHLVGHNTIRSEVMGIDNRPPTQQELMGMKELVAKGMKEGAVGLSTGLFYTPGSYASTDEVIDLSSEAKKYGGIYASHIRDESNYNIGLEASVKEAIQIGKEADIPVQISHLKALGKPVWGSAEKICSLIEDAGNSGLKVFADQYPYAASSTSFTAAVIPGWVRADGKMKERLADKKLLPEIKKGIAENIDRRGGAEAFLIIPSENNGLSDAKYLSEICEETGLTPVEAALSLVEKGNSSIISFNMDEKDVEYFMKKNYVMTSSDGHIEVPGESMTHPRSYGSFPRKLRKYAIDDKIITVQQFVRSATTLPAEMFGLHKRGKLEPGYIADIAIIDPEKISDKATFTEPHQYSEGVEFLFINGQLVIEDGKYNNKLAGKTIRF
jgi:N-acyl-D-amino-acid deacylase